MVEFNLFGIFLWIVLLFFILLFVKQFLPDEIRGSKIKKNFCVICITISLTWIILLIMYLLGNFDNNVIIGLLMGSSILGVYYLVEHKVKEKYSLFRLPFLLTLFFIGYVLLSPNTVSFEITNFARVIVLLLVLWILFILLLVYHKNKFINNVVNKILECCKKW